MHILYGGMQELKTMRAGSIIIKLAEVFPQLGAMLNSQDRSASSIQLSHCKQAFAMAGNYVIPSPPRQQYDSFETLYEQASQSIPVFNQLLQEYTRKSGAVSFIPSQDIVKTKGRIHTKARDDYNGDYSRVCDILRTTITVNSPEQIRRLGNLLRPSNNSNVVRYEDSFSKPDEDGGIRRLLANVRLPNGHVVEIQVRHEGMEHAYKQTEDLYLRARATKARLEQTQAKAETEGRSTAEVNALLLPMQKKHDHFMAQRTQIHEKAAKRHKLDELILDRNFHLIDGFPVMQTYDKHSGEFNVVVPDPKTGKYVTDNSFVPLLSDASHAVESVDRNIFIARSRALVASDGVKAHLHLA